MFCVLLWFNCCICYIYNIILIFKYYIIYNSSCITFFSIHSDDFMNLNDFYFDIRLKEIVFSILPSKSLESPWSRSCPQGPNTLSPSRVFLWLKLLKENWIDKQSTRLETKREELGCKIQYCVNIKNPPFPVHPFTQFTIHCLCLYMNSRCLTAFCSYLRRNKQS